MNRDEAVEDRLIGELEKAQKRIKELEYERDERRNVLCTLRTACGCERKVVMRMPIQRVYTVPLQRHDGRFLGAALPDEALANSATIRSRSFHLMGRGPGRDEFIYEEAP